MQSTPESTQSTLSDFDEGVQYSGGPNDCRAPNPPRKGLYYAHIKYVWKLNEDDMAVLKDIDMLLSGAGSRCDDATNPTEHAKLARISMRGDCASDFPRTSPFMTTIDSGPGAQLPTPSSGLQKGHHRFPSFRVLSTTCVYSTASSYLLDDYKSMCVYEACRSFVRRGLPILESSGKLKFEYMKV